MDDKEFYERVSILVDDFSSQIGGVVLQDYANLNEVAMELAKRKVAAGGRGINELGKRYRPEVQA